MDVVVTLCLHTYHLLYAITTFSQSLQCHAATCVMKDVPEEWVNIMGFRTLSGITCTYSTSLVLKKHSAHSTHVIS